MRLTCKDLGFACDHELEAENEEELLAAAARHALDEHGTKLDATELEQLRSTLRVRDVGAQ